MHSNRSRIAGVALLFQLGLLAPGCLRSHELSDETPPAVEKVPATLRQQVSLGAPSDVLVELLDLNGLAEGDDAGVASATDNALVDPTDPNGTPRSVDADVNARAQRYRQAQAAILDALDPSDVELRLQYENVPYLFVRVHSSSGLEALASRPEVLRLHEERQLAHQLAESLPLIHQPAAAAAGQAGLGTSVAVLDTGCDYTRADFGACSTAGAANCKIAYAADFAASDNALDDNGHGTNVAAIVLGVAPRAKVLALDVFSGATASSSVILSAIDWTIKNRSAYNIVALNLSLGSGQYSAVCGTDLFASALANARAAGIAPVVASGNDGNASALASPACTPAAVSVGAVYDANVGGITYSTCSDATTLADKITCFSNSASFLSVLAPGALITAGGYTMAGTSQASPHVAGALAVLRGAFPSESLNTSIARLTETGPSVIDPRNKVSKRRLDLQAALNSTVALDTTPPVGATLRAVAGNSQVALSWSAATDGGGSVSYRVYVAPNLAPACGAGTLAYAGSALAFTQTSLQNGSLYGYHVCPVDPAGNVGVGSVSSARPAPEFVPPVGSVSINGGALYTNSSAVKLTLAASDASGLSGMCISNGASCSAWETFGATRSWTLGAGSGATKVYVWFKDKYENVTSAPVTAAITIDNTAPTGGSLSATSGAKQIALSWTSASDPSGIGSYRLVYAAGNNAPSSCASGTLLYTGSALGFIQTGLTSGAAYSYRLCAVDKAGNSTAGLTRTVRAR